MNNRIIDMSENGAALSIRLNQLVISRRNLPEVTIPVTDIAVLSVSNPGVTYTQSVLVELAEAGAILVVSDSKHLPIATLFPLNSHSTQTETMRRQADATRPLMKRLWKELVVAKIQTQVACLEARSLECEGIAALIPRVKSGDSTNVEARAARLYWVSLMGKEFRRNRDESGPNAALNFGYAVLRAMTARAVVSAGLHPSLGLHHHNRYDPFALADDLMEPFRPLVDLVVSGVDLGLDGADGLSRAMKSALIGSLLRRVPSPSGERTLFDVLARISTSLAEIFRGEAERLWMPQWSEFFHFSPTAVGD